MKELPTIEVVIETDGTPISTIELSDYLYHFRAIYAAALEYKEFDHSLKLTNEEALDLADNIRSKIFGSEWTRITDWAHAELGNEDLKIIDIRRENPLIIVFSGVAIALTMAVIISGGSLKLGPLQVKLPPLGKGIKELRSAFGCPPKNRNSPPKKP